MSTWRVVLDANIYISALMRPDSPPGRILRAATEGVTVCALVSPPLINELRTALDYPRLQRYLKMTTQEKDDFVILLEQVTDLFNIDDYPPPGICRDPRDEPYLQAALAGRADFIITGDADLLSLGKIEDIPILAPADFERVLNSSKQP